MTRESPYASSRLLLAATCCALALLTATLFRAVVGFELLEWDDQLHLTANPFIQPDSPDRYAHFWREPYAKLYIPIAYNLWALVYAHCFEGGVFSPARLHLLNLVVHAINAGLAFLLIARLLRASTKRTISAAAIGALFFAVHPLQVEPVAWIAEFRGLSAAMLGLIAWLVHLRATDVRRRSTAVALEGVATLSFAAALLCKPSVAPLPMMVAIVDLLLERRTRPQVASRLGSWFILAGACLVAMSFLQSGSPNAGPIYLRPLIAIDALVFYLGKLVWPFALSVDYSRTPTSALQDTSLWWTWVIPLWIVGLLAWKPNRPAIASAALFLLALSPVLGLIPFEFQFLSTVADRYAYLALLGPGLLLAFALATTPRWAVAGILLCGLLGWRSVDQLRHWRSDESVWTHAAAVNPRAVVATANLAAAAADRGDVSTAKRLFDRVIALDPQRVNGYIGNGSLLERAGDLDGALAWYERARRTDPAHAEPPGRAGEILLRQGRVDEAIASLRDALARQPDAIHSLNGLGSAYLAQNRLDEAAAQFDRVLELDPRHMQAHINRALVLRERGDLRGFVDSMNRARRFAGNDPTPLDLLGQFALQLGDWRAARESFERSLALSPGRVQPMTQLATALAGSGDVDRAIGLLEEALKLAPGSEVIQNNLRSARELKRRGSATAPSQQQ